MQQRFNLVVQCLMLNVGRLLVVNAKVPSTEHQVTVLIEQSFALRYAILKLTYHRTHDRHQGDHVADSRDDHVHQW
uniref:Putative secreted protein n=1 Tax=Anopheles marajoara TaxID=58244 RepID=A0A2M4CD93_9DIPT